MTKILLPVVFFFFSISIAAADTDKSNKKLMKQVKADIETVKGYLRNEKDQEKNLIKGEGLIRNYLKDTLLAENISLHLLLTDVVKKEYQITNEQVYLKHNVDTAKLMNYCRTMFLTYQKLDSVDAKPNEKGIVAPSYRKKNAEYLAPYRDNLFKGGLYFFAHNQWVEAWKMMDTYLDCRQQPLFSATSLDSINDTYAAYIAVKAANNMDDYNLALKYSDEALTYHSSYENTLIMMSELSLKNQDSVRYIGFLKQGFEYNVNSRYFFPRIIDYFTSKEDYLNAEFYTNEALKNDSTSELFLLAKHNLSMIQKQYDDALEYGKKVLDINPSAVQPTYNVAYIYYLRAKEIMNSVGKSYSRRMKEAQKYYKDCRVYMESYRKLRPEDVQRWKPILYEVYLNLNMGKEFSEIEKL